MEWLNRSTKDDFIKLSESLFQVDFEQIGLKRTNKQDDFIHTLVLNNSPSLREKYIDLHLNSLSQEEKLLFHMTVIFRTPREATRRIKFILDKKIDNVKSYEKHYNYLNMNDDFRHLFRLAIKSVDQVSKLSNGEYNFQNLKQIFELTLEWLSINKDTFFNLLY